ncbi:MAG: hypothetical protein CMG60_07905 [Candidatus Marinimicrobia bacterium]|nr:hypothetical protein [Candidatus Neomarinimicrobiota bacterium]|tara:strand:+ start:32582 stop:32983 length:402 start_codon:yes stop_codon:yes gene_type:complete
MIFENIKPGDLVLVPVEVRIGWNSRKYRIPQKVTRTTRTQIIVNGKRYRRDDGRAIGSGGYFDEAYPTTRHDKDETIGYNAAKTRADAIEVINNVAPDLEVLTRNDRLQTIKAANMLKAAEFMRLAVEALQNE